MGPARRLLFCLCLGAALALAQTPAAVTSDPAPNRAHPARMEQMAVALNGAVVYGSFYAAAGAGAHGTVLLLHGFPGYEQNLDLAQAMRRAGWNVMTFHYRGAWGSHGNFSFRNAMNDTTAMLDYLRLPAQDIRLGIDPRRIVVVGHSMGGFMAAYAGARDPWLDGIVMISAWNIGAEAAQVTPATEPAMLQDFATDTGPLAGCTPASLLAEARQNALAWNFVGFAPALKYLPILLLDANDDSRPDALALQSALAKDGDRSVQELHFDTDHSYSGQRIALESVVLRWLAAR